MSEPVLTKLGNLPRYPFSFLWADYVELLCLCSLDGRFSRGEMGEIAQEGDDIVIDNDDEPRPGPSEEADDAVAARWEDIKARLRQRERVFPDWPFRLEGNVLHRAFDIERPAHRLYVALLIASSLRLCAKRREGEVTAAFEEISFLVLRASLPPTWQVRPFGAHQTLPGAYTGTLRAKFERLADDICATLVKKADEYDPSDSGDGGVDIVAWQEMGDQRGNMPVIMAQCACSPTDWETKQLSATPSQVESHIRPHHPPAAYCFVPHDLAASESRWERASHVHRVVLMDRLRLMKFASRSDMWDNIPAWSFVAEAADMRYDPRA